MPEERRREHLCQHLPCWLPSNSAGGCNLVISRVMSCLSLGAIILWKACFGMYAGAVAGWTRCCDWDNIDCSLCQVCLPIQLDMDRVSSVWGHAERNRPCGCHCPAARGELSAFENQLLATPSYPSTTPVGPVPSTSTPLPACCCCTAATHALAYGCCCCSDGCI